MLVRLRPTRVIPTVVECKCPCVRVEREGGGSGGQVGCVEPFVLRLEAARDDNRVVFDYIELVQDQSVGV